MKVTNYSQWKSAVSDEHRKLVEVSYYLNEDGKERMRVFDTLGNLAAFCGTAEELLSWIESREDFDQSDVSAVESCHARLAIRSLRNIAKKSEE